jgi:hypothetical protein
VFDDNMEALDIEHVGVTAVEAAAPTYRRSRRAPPSSAAPEKAKNLSAANTLLCDQRAERNLCDGHVARSGVTSRAR